MMREWKTYKLKDAVYINPYVSLRKGTTAKKVSMDKLQSNNRYIPSYELAEYTGGAKFTNGDTIMARITPCLENGKIAQVGILDEGEVGFGSTEYIVFRAREGITDKDFVYSLVCSNFIREPAVKSMVGSSNRQRVQTDVVENLEIAFPPLNEQIKIAKLLRAFDDKIKLNNSINTNLHNQGKEIVNNYFIKTKSKTVLSDLMNFENGFAFQSGSYQKKGDFRVITIKNVQDGYIDSSDTAFLQNIPNKMKSCCKLQVGDIIISLTGNVGRVGIVYETNLLLNQRVAKVVPRNCDLKAYLYFVFHQQAVKTMLETLSKGTAQQNLSTVETLKLDIPYDEKTISTIIPQLNSIYNLLVNNFMENKRLAELRDTLLPKLMSGEISIN